MIPLALPFSRGCAQRTRPLAKRAPVVAASGAEGEKDPRTLKSERKLAILRKLAGDDGAAESGDEPSTSGGGADDPPSPARLHKHRSRRSWNRRSIPPSSLHWLAPLYSKEETPADLLAAVDAAMREYRSKGFGGRALDVYNIEGRFYLR